jgi:hypothetical protein
VWARIEGGTGPPLSPQVWLQGDSGAWKPRDPNLGDLWDALRIAVLAAAWRLRCRRTAWDSQFTPTDVAKAAIADLFFFPRSLYTLGKAYACKARSECDSVWASAPGIGQPGSASKPLWHREETLKTIHGYAT